MALSVVSYIAVTGALRATTDVSKKYVAAHRMYPPKPKQYQQNRMAMALPILIIGYITTSPELDTGIKGIRKQALPPLSPFLPPYLRLLYPAVHDVPVLPLQSTQADILFGRLVKLCLRRAWRGLNLGGLAYAHREGAGGGLICCMP